MNRAITIFAPLLLSACVGMTPGPWDVPPGSTVTINKEIQIPADSASVKIQNGKTEAFGAINIYATHCVLELRKRLDRPQIVKPGQFTVTKNEQQTFMAFAPRGGTQVAGLFLAGDVDSIVNYANQMYITSPEQPDVYRLTCQQYSIPSQTFLNDRWSSVAQMRVALGELITLKLAGSP